MSTVTPGFESDIKGERYGDAKAIGQPSHQHAAAGKAEHDHGEGQGCVGAADAKIGLDRRQRHHDRPHADAADGGERHRHQQAQPCSRRVNDGVRFVRRYIHAWKPGLSLRW